MILFAENGLVKAIPVSAQPPGTPTNLVVLARLSSVKLTWGAAARAAKYRVYRNGSLLAETTERTIRDLGAAVGQTYAYTVQAVDTYGQRGTPTVAVNGFVNPATNHAPNISVKTWPATLATDGTTIVRVNAEDIDAQVLAMTLGVNAGSLASTTDPSVWTYTP